MKIKKFTGFDAKGNLPQGVYNMTLEEVEKLFSTTNKRKEIMQEYKKHLDDIKKTGYLLDHWVDGSFITSEKNPEDIDTLTELNGEKVDAHKDKEKMEELINNAQHRTNYLCHSLKVYKYPPTDEENFKRYIKTKRRILFKLFGTDRQGNPKGFIHLIGDDINVL